MADITVTDPSHPSHLVEEFLHMRKAGELFDYDIKGQSRSFHIHSLVLAAVSPVFKTMLLADMKESEKKEATFPSISDDNMSQLIEFAYTGTCTFSGSQLMDLISAVHYLQMSKLLTLCEERIRDVLQPSNCFSCLLFAERLKLTGIMPHIQNMMRVSVTDIIMAGEFQQLQLSEVERYLCDVRDHGASSDDVLSGVLQWIQHDAQQRSENMPQLFKLVPFAKCSERFVLKMMTQNAKLLEMQQSVYKMMLSEVLTSTMPKQFGEDKTILVLGGQSNLNVPNSDCWMLNQGKMTKYSEVSTEHNLQGFCSVCKVPDGMLFTGGSDSDMCVRFVLTTKQWVKMKALLAKRYSHGSGCINGKVLVISGNVAGTLSTSVHIMKFEKNVWFNGPSLPTSEHHAKVVVYSTTIFVLLSSSGRWYQLDADEMSWSTKSPLPQPSFGCSLAASEHRIFAAGGDNNINFMYVPTSDAWCRLTGPSLQERQGSLVYYQHKLYLLAGCKRDATLTDVEQYDIDCDKWSLTNWKLPTPLIIFKACLVDVPK